MEEGKKGKNKLKYYFEKGTDTLKNELRKG